MQSVFKSGLIAGGGVGVLTIVLIAAVGAFVPVLGLCMLWALGLGAGLLASYLAKPTQTGQALQTGGIAGALTSIGNYLGMAIGAVLLRYVVYPSGIISPEYLPSGVNTTPFLFLVRNPCMCGVFEGSIILVFSLIGAWFGHKLFRPAGTPPIGG